MTPGARRLGFALGLGLACLVGCPGTEPARDGQGAEAGRTGVEPGGWARAATPEESLGTIIADSQPVEHVFKVMNPLGTPLDLLDEEVSQPCCSAIGPHPRRIGPHESVDVPVVVKPGLEGGYKRIEFKIHTNSASLPVYRLGLSMDRIAALEVHPDEQNHSDFLAGEAGKLRYTIITRRLGERGLGAPTSFSANPPLSVALEHEAKPSHPRPEIDEFTSRLVVDIATQERPGRQRGEILLFWSGGVVRPIVVDWAVKPHVRATPEGIFISPSAGTPRVRRQVVLRSASAPFLVRGASCDEGVVVVARLPTAPAMTHSFEIEVDVSRPGTAVRQVTFDLDHPHQQAAKVAILVNPSGGPG